MFRRVAMMWKSHGHGRLHRPCRPLVNDTKGSLRSPLPRGISAKSPLTRTPAASALSRKGRGLSRARWYAQTNRWHSATSPHGDLCEKPPHPARLRRSALSRRRTLVLRRKGSRAGRGLCCACRKALLHIRREQPSPLAGEGGRQRRPGEGAFAQVSHGRGSCPAVGRRAVLRTRAAATPAGGERYRHHHAPAECGACP